MLTSEWATKLFKESSVKFKVKKRGLVVQNHSNEENVHHSSKELPVKLITAFISCRDVSDKTGDIAPDFGVHLYVDSVR